MASFNRAYRARPDYQKTVLGINKAKCAIENSLSRTNGFNFLTMKDIIEDIIKEADYKSREEERYKNQLRNTNSKMSYYELMNIFQKTSKRNGRISG